MTAVVAMAAAVATSQIVSGTTAQADLGHGTMWVAVGFGSGTEYGDTVLVVGSISDESWSCNGFADCDTPVGTVTLMLNGVPYTTSTTPGAITPIADFDFALDGLSAGSYSGFADFSGNFTVLGSDLLAFTVAERSCDTRLTQSLATTAENGAVILTANVSSSSAQASGEVTFYQDDGTPALDIVLATAPVIPLTNTATSSNVGPLLPIGSTEIYAVYSGDANHEDDCRSNDVVHMVQADPPPTAGDDSVVTQRNAPVTFNVLANDGDPGGGALIGPEVDGAGPEHGSLTGGGGGLIYTPDEDFVGDDSFQYYVTDSNGTQSALATVTIEVVCSSIAAADAFTTDFDTPIVVTSPSSNLLTNDDPCERAVQVGRSPAHGIITGFDGFNGTFTYTPDAGYYGPDSFTYVYLSGAQVISVGRVGIIVRSDPNAPPTSTTSTIASTTTTSLAATGPSTTGATGTTAAVAPGRPLPSTGRTSGGVLVTAVALIGAGLAMVALRRPRHRPANE